MSWPVQHVADEMKGREGGRERVRSEGEKGKERERLPSSYLTFCCA